MAMEVILMVDGRKKASWREYYHGQKSAMEFMFSEAFDPSKIDKETGVFAVEPEVLEQRLRPALYFFQPKYRAKTREEKLAIQALKRLIAEYRLARTEKKPVRLMIFY